MRTAVHGYGKSATSANRGALSRGEKAALALVGSVMCILMSIGFLHLVDRAIEREAAFEAERLRPYLEEYNAHEERLRLEKQMREDLYPSR